ncbi:MAG TPA: DNA repair protein RecO [Planctomycetaceae bacterium]|nr:DNA repair protein RecO [Planctomycetaceae bacterium]
MENAEALVLRTVDFSESSLILTLLTREFGKIEGMAKGARRTKNPFETSLDLLARIRVSFLRKKGDVLDLLTEAKLLRRFRPSPSNFAGLYAAYYWISLIDALTENGDPQPGLFDLAVATLNRFEAGTHVVRTLLRAEWFLLRQIGQQPVLDRCVACGKPVTETNIVRAKECNQRFSFGLSDGGILCSRCRTAHRQVMSVSAGALHDLKILIRPKRAERALQDDRRRDEQMIGGATPRENALHEATLREEWAETPMERSTINEIRGWTNQYFWQILGKRPQLQGALALIARYDPAQDDPAQNNPAQDDSAQDDLE